MYFFSIKVEEDDIGKYDKNTEELKIEIHIMKEWFVAIKNRVCADIFYLFPPVFWWNQKVY